MGIESGGSGHWSLAGSRLPLLVKTQFPSSSHHQLYVYTHIPQLLSSNDDAVGARSNFELRFSRITIGKRERPRHHWSHQVSDNENPVLH